MWCDANGSSLLFTLSFLTYMNFMPKFSISNLRRKWVNKLNSLQQKWTLTWCDGLCASSIHWSTLGGENYFSQIGQWLEAKRTQSLAIWLVGWKWNGIRFCETGSRPSSHCLEDSLLSRSLISANTRSRVFSLGALIVSMPTYNHEYMDSPSTSSHILNQSSRK